MTYFCYLCHFMMGLISKPKLCAKFEIPIVSAIAKILKGNPNYWKASLAQGNAHFSSGWDFMILLGKVKLCAKFEVSPFSHCVNIQGEHPNIGKFPSLAPRPLFLPYVMLWWALANPSCFPNLKSLALAVAKILKRNPKIFGSSSSPRQCAIFLRV